MKSGILVGVLFVVLTAVPASSQTIAAGRIKTVSGSAFIVRGDQTLPARLGAELFEADALRTGSDGYLGVILKDDTRISLGPASEVRVGRFVFAPAESRFAVTLGLVRGVAAYVSGQIAKLAPDAIRLETPAAIVGIRGTSLVLRSE